MILLDLSGCKLLFVDGYPIPLCDSTYSFGYYNVVEVPRKCKLGYISGGFGHNNRFPMD